MPPHPALRVGQELNLDLLCGLSLSSSSIQHMLPGLGRHLLSTTKLVQKLIQSGTSMFSLNTGPSALPSGGTE